MINKAITAPITYPKVELTSTGLDAVNKIVAFISNHLILVQKYTGIYMDFVRINIRGIKIL